MTENGRPGVPGEVAHALFVLGAFWRQFQLEDAESQFPMDTSKDDVANAATCL